MSDGMIERLDDQVVKERWEQSTYLVITRSIKLPRLLHLNRTLRRALMHMPRTARSTAGIVLSAVDIDQLLDEICGHLGVPEEDTPDTLSDIWALTPCWKSVSYVTEADLGLLFQCAESGCADEEGAHVVGRGGVGIDVFETVGCCCHVLLAVVVADEVHDC